MTTTAQFTVDNPCPDWCTLEPGHPVDSIHDDDRRSRGHSGPNFGAHLTVCSVEYTDVPGVHVPFVELYSESEDLDMVGLLLFARHALEAAAWLEIERDKAGLACLATGRADAWLAAHQ
ncbi:hypothetical protein EUA06_11165 [Nocardioides glacieisoli]|uniref:Uncharacterized protein n=1 Tax=Nocardioides glacieisoli TaxID=1168730 RepID=A0A4Q2RQ95_9ACTN|nr:hypothetical protein [Nocardioides glacieisoli]RYB90828.1 hypothetical protein EUA06_11165 [Nocardioides glacieisoli]